MTAIRYCVLARAAPIARVHTASLAGDDPAIMLTAPIPATAEALQKSGLSLDDIGPGGPASDPALALASPRRCSPTPSTPPEKFQPNSPNRVRILPRLPISASPPPPPERPGYLTTGRRHPEPVLILSELDTTIGEFISDKYHHRTHPEIYESPHRAWLGDG